MACVAPRVDGLGRGSELGRRLALNTQLILREESQLARVVDPAGGSWYVESLTDRVLLYTDDGDTAAHGIHERGLVPESVLVRRSTLEDVFLHLTGRTLIE
jgi:hypothetical protein